MQGHKIVAIACEERAHGVACHFGAVDAITQAVGDLQQVFDGMPRNVSVATDPVGLAVEITYGGASEAPVDAGSYAVLATAVDPNYEGAAMDTLVAQLQTTSSYLTQQLELLKTQTSQ